MSDQATEMSRPLESAPLDSRPLDSRPMDAGDSAPATSRPGVIQIAIKEKTALYAAYMPFVAGGGLFVPTTRPGRLGDEIYIILSLMDDPAKIPITGKIVWITPADMLNLNASEMVATCKAQMEQEQEGTVLGLQADYDTLPATTYRFERATRLLDAVNRMSETDVHLSLAHEPPSDAFLKASASHDTPDEKFLTQPSIVFAGHYCGGAWRLPFLGAFYIPSTTADRHGWFPAQEDVKGLTTVSETHLYITAGLSTPGAAPVMGFRMLNSPEISVIELTATLPESMLGR